MIPIVGIFGPTASGKSEVAMAVAQKVQGEIVNADAAQIYRGLDLGAAKLPLAARGNVAHHLMDLADPDLLISVAVYQELAFQTIEEIRRRGRVPIVCGGSGMYMRAALGEWRFEGASPDLDLRRELAALSGPQLHRRLALMDRAAAARLSPSDRPRIIRAIERLGTAGTSSADAVRAPEQLAPVLKFGLYVQRPELYRRIDERARALWPELLQETRRLIGRGLTGDLPAQRAIGYREALLFLRQEMPEEEAIVKLQQSTRRFAKRQMTWWRREPNTIWIGVNDASERIVDVLDCIRNA